MTVNVSYRGGLGPDQESRCTAEMINLQLSGMNRLNRNLVTVWSQVGLWPF